MIYRAIYRQLGGVESDVGVCGWWEGGGGGGGGGVVVLLTWQAGMN